MVEAKPCYVERARLARVSGIAYGAHGASVRSSPGCRRKLASSAGVLKINSRSLARLSAMRRRARRNLAALDGHVKAQ